MNGGGEGSRVGGPNGEEHGGLFQTSHEFDLKAGNQRTWILISVYALKDSRTSKNLADLDKLSLSHP